MKTRRSMEITEDDIKSLERLKKKKRQIEFYDSNKNNRNSNNNNNNNNNISSDGFDIDGMNQTEIGKLARSLGLITNYNNLEETKDKIKSTLNQKKQLDKENCESSNPFNINYGELKIKDNIEPIEYLFFKVFRNKYIFKQIFSNMDKLSTIAYESIMSINKMIKRDQISMLKDKVYRKQTLTNLDNLEEFFKYFKNDKTFIQLFFNNYRNDIYGMVLCMEDVAKQAIYSDCKAALELLVEEYQFKPTIEFINSLFSLSKIKHIKYLLEIQNSEFDLNKDIDKILYTIKNSSNSIKVIKLLEYLLGRDLIDHISVYNIINLLFQNKLDPLELKLKYLVYINNIIASNNSNSLGSGDIINNQDFSKKELNSYCYQLFNFSIEKRQIIKKLINEIYTLRKDKRKSLEYHSAFGDESEPLIGGKHSEIFLNNAKYPNCMAFGCGNFRILDEFVFRYNPYLLITTKLFSTVFENIGNQEYDREKKRDFIIKLCGYIRKNQYRFLDQGQFNISFLVSLEDLELLQLFKKEIGDFDKIKIELSSIKSVQVLNYLFQEFQNCFISSLEFNFKNVLSTTSNNNKNMILWERISSVALLSRLEVLASKTKLKFRPLSIVVELNDDIIQYVLERPHIYPLKKQSSKQLEIPGNFQYSRSRFKLILHFIYQHLNESKDNIVSFGGESKYSKLKIIHHLLCNGFKSQVFSNDNVQTYLIHYVSNNYEEAVKDMISYCLSNFIDNPLKILFIAIRKQDFNFLNLFLKELLPIIYDLQKQSSKINYKRIKSLLSSIIKNSYSKGYFKVIEFIHLNYTSILCGSTKNQNRIFTLDELREILVKTEPKDFKIFMYLLNIINVTRLQYQKINSQCKYFKLLVSNNKLN